MAKAEWTLDPSDLLRVGPTFDLESFDRASTPGWDSGSKEADQFRLSRGELLSEMQERLFANARAGGEQRILLVLQGMDTAGKGGIVRHVAGMMDPQGLAIRSFGVPTEEERSHHYLWRIRNALPSAGRIGIFDRSHYEDVLVVRVDQLADVDWEERYAEINRFEEEVAASGTTIIKVALLVSYEEQGLRLMRRLQRPDKHWKFTSNDVDSRSKWDAYQHAYQEMLAHTSTENAPWYAIPADNKWYARLAVTELVSQALASLKLSWPEVAYDVETEKQRLATTMDPEAVAKAREGAEEKRADVAEDIEEYEEQVARVNELAATDSLATLAENGAKPAASPAKKSTGRG
nr:polyphosphate kinase 2 family protein [Actinomycetales bacterium]